MKTAALMLGLVAFGCGVAVAAEPEVLFEDRFDGKLAEGWTWLRENPDTWRIREGALEIRVEPGVADTVKNALVRPAPDRRQGAFAVEVTVSNLSAPKQQYEQAGITWYVAGKPVFKVVKELIDGDIWIIPGKKPVTDVPIRLRMVVRGDQWTAQYKPEGEAEYLTAAEGKLPPQNEDQVSIQCYHAPPEGEHWMRFEDFRIVRLAE